MIVIYGECTTIFRVTANSALLILISTETLIEFKVDPVIPPEHTVFEYIGRDQVSLTLNCAVAFTTLSPVT
jgi:hypothetical protein